MITIISTAVGFVYGAYMAYIAGKEHGFYRAAARLTENLGTLSNITRN